MSFYKRFRPVWGWQAGTKRVCSALAIFEALLRMCNGKGHCEVQKDRLADEAGLQPVDVGPAMERLEEGGLLLHWPKPRRRIEVLISPLLCEGRGLDCGDLPLDEEALCELVFVDEGDPAYRDWAMRIIHRGATENPRDLQEALQDPWYRRQWARLERHVQALEAEEQEAKGA